MRPPHIEAAILLAAHGFPVPSNADLKGRPMPAPLPFALFTHPDRPSVKARAFTSLRQLAAHIDQQRKGAPLQILDETLHVEGDVEPRAGANVWTLSEGGDRQTYLGWAFLDGGKAQALREALWARRPQPTRAA